MEMKQYVIFGSVGRSERKIYTFQAHSDERAREIANSWCSREGKDIADQCTGLTVSEVEYRSVAVLRVTRAA